MTRWFMLLITLTGCTGADADTDVDPGPAMRWADALAPYASCTMERTWYPEHGTDVGYREVVEYDAHGVWTTWQLYDVAFSDGDRTGDRERVVDALGRVTEDTYYDARTGEIGAIVTWTFDDVGQIGATLTYPSHAGLDQRYVMEHDALGRTVLEEGDEDPYDGEPEVVTTYRYDADAQGRGTWFDWWQADHEATDYYGAPGYEAERTFDAEGRMLTQAMQEYGANPNLRTCTVTYDDNGREAGEICEAPPESFKWKYVEITYDWSCP